MFGLFSKNEKELSLLLEVQSGFVRAALVGHDSNIIHVASHKVPLVSDIESTRMVKTVLKAVRDVMQDILKVGMFRAHNLGYSTRKIQKIDYIFSSPWVISESKTVKVSYPSETIIGKDFIAHIMEDECAALSKKYELAEAEHIEQKIFEIRLNGYAVTHFEGRKAKDLEVSFATSVVSKKFLQRIRNEVGRVVHIEKEACHSALLIQYNAMRFLNEHKHEYIYAHIHDELTDIVIVKNGLCTQLSSLPFGTKTLIRKIAFSLKEPALSSESIISLLSEQKLDPTSAEKVKKIVANVIQKWKADFFSAITTTIPPSLVPRTIYLSAHTYFEIFRDIIILENQFNFEVIPYEQMTERPHLEFEKPSEYSLMIEVYVFSLKHMV